MFDLITHVKNFAITGLEIGLLFGCNGSDGYLYVAEGHGTGNLWFPYLPPSLSHLQFNKTYDSRELNDLTLSREMQLTQQRDGKYDFIKASFILD
jgi:hypothetical protein